MSFPTSQVPEHQAQTQKLEKTVNSGQQIFDEVSALGVGRFYCRTEKMSPPKASSADILGRIEALSNSKSEPSIEMSLPMGVSLPVNMEETKHVVVFANGEMALVESKPNQTKSYQDFFATTNSNNDYFMLWVMGSNSPVGSLKIAASLGYSVIDPISSDQNEKLVLDALDQAKKTALSIKKQQVGRKRRFEDEALKILRSQNE